MDGLPWTGSCAGAGSGTAAAEALEAAFSPSGAGVTAAGFAGAGA
jgi:hypothetical protein